MSGAAAQHMDRMYRFQRHIYDITRRYYLLGRTTLIDGLCPPEGGSVLEIGCGTGWNLIRTAYQYPTCRLAGFDISRQMLNTASANIAKAGLSQRIAVEMGDATSFSTSALFSHAAFDRVFTSYTLSMIPAWPLVIESALNHVSPAGSFHVVDFGGGEEMSGPLRAGLHAWLRKFDVTPRTDMHNVLKATAARRGFSLFYEPLHRGYAQYAVLQRR